jgi:hypothetical protein
VTQSLGSTAHRAVATRLARLVDPDVAARERAAGGIAVAKINRERIQGAGFTVIRNIDIVCHFRCIIQMRRAAERGSVAGDGNGPNPGGGCTLPGDGITEGDGARATALGSGGTEIKSDLVSLVFDLAVPVGHGLGARAGIVEFRARDRKPAVDHGASRDQDQTARQQSGGVIFARGVETTSK